MAIDINDISRRNQYTATSSQQVFIYSFPIMANTDISVYLTPIGQDASDPVDILVLTTDYSVTGVGDEGGGTVVLGSGATTGDIISITGNTMSLSRTAVFSTNATIASETLDEEFNNLLIMVQQINTKLEKLQTQYQYSAVVDSAIDRRLPVLGSSQAWVMNDDSTGIEAVTIEESGTADLLEAELADNQSGSDGARKVGFYHATYGGTTVHAMFNTIISDISGFATLTDVQKSEWNAVTVTGTDAYIGTLSPTPAGYNAGMVIHLVVGNQNTTSCTINLNGLGVKDLADHDGSALIAGELETTKVYQFYYNGTKWIMFKHIEIASEAEAIAGTNNTKAITPLGLAAASINVYGVSNGTGTLAASFGLVSYVQTDTGVFEGVLTKPMQDVNYVIQPVISETSNRGAVNGIPLTATTFRILVCDLQTIPKDWSHSFTINGTLA